MENGLKEGEKHGINSIVSKMTVRGLVSSYHVNKVGVMSAKLYHLHYCSFYTTLWVIEGHNRTMIGSEVDFKCSSSCELPRSFCETNDWRDYY